MITQFPTPPSRNDAPDLFTSRADAFLGAFPGFVDEVNPEIENINTKSAQVSADAAASESARSVAVAAANFKGDWSSLTGPLDIPASVAHQGVVWVLLEDVGDVAAVEPGVSSVWLSVPDIASDADIHAGTVNKLVDAAGIYSANAPVVSSGSGAWEIDLAEGRVFKRTLTDNLTLSNPVNQVPGQSGMIILKQDGTGGHTISYGSDWTTPPVAEISPEANVTTLLSYYVDSVGEIYLTISEGYE